MKPSVKQYPSKGQMPNDGDVCLCTFHNEPDRDGHLTMWRCTYVKDEGFAPDNDKEFRHSNDAIAWWVLMPV